MHTQAPDTNGDRTVAHFDLDSFFVSVECLLDPRLKGKPVLIGGTGDRGVVASCSYEARQFGVHSAMPMKMALRLCPDALVRRGDYDQYAKYSTEVTEIIREGAPLYEKTSIDEFYLDLTGMDRFFGCWKWATELRQKVMKETGLPISLGMSPNKTVSKIATGEAKPNGAREVSKGTEKPFLAPLSIRKIPGVGEKSYHLFRQMGVEKIATVQQMPVELMQTTFGEHGLMIWKKANGIDNTPVTPYTERKSISEEQTFQQDTIDIIKLKADLVGMTARLAFQLRKEGKVARCVSVKIRYSDFDTHTRQVRIAYTSADHILIPKVKELFDTLYERRQLVRLIGVKLSELVSGHYQIDLFDDNEDMIKLYQAMDKMRKRFGDDKVVRAINTPTESEREVKRKLKEEGLEKQNVHLFKRSA